MLTKILQRLREPSFSTTSMADMLFTLTTDKDGEDFLIETAGLRSVEGLSLEKARTEIVFLNLSAIYVALFRYRDVLGWRVEKLDSMYAQYLTHIKAIRQELGGEREEELLQALEARVTTYNKIHDLWREAHENDRGHEQTFAIGEAFFSFCDTPHFNPISLSPVQHHFFAVIRTVIKTLKEYKLV
jgi:hypothetical protein